MESSLFEIKQLLFNINESLLKYDPDCRVIVGGSVSTGRFTFIHDKTLILLSDLDLYVRTRNCLLEYTYILRNTSYWVKNFEVSPSSKLGIRCSCTNCLKSSIESNLLYRHSIKYGEILSEWLMNPNLVDKSPKAYLPERLGAAYCLLKTILYYRLKSNFNTYSTLYQIYKFSELYGGCKIEFTKILWGRKIAFNDFLKSIYKSLEYFKSILNRYLSTKNYIYISSVLDLLFSSSTPNLVNLGNDTILKTAIQELCGSTLNSALENKNISSTIYKNTNHVPHALYVYVLGSEVAKA